MLIVKLYRNFDNRKSGFRCAKTKRVCDVYIALRIFEICTFLGYHRLTII